MANQLKIALTGGATGIGAEVAAKLHAEGHHVTAFDISEPKEGVDRWIETDLSSPTSITAAVEAANGQYDALVNNAGLPPRDGLEETILQVNYFGMKSFCDGMINKIAHGGAIVNVASRAGAFWRDNLDEIKALMMLDPAGLGDFIKERSMTPTRAYNLSKEAVIVMTMAQTEDMIARKIRANSVSPAAVSTGILKDFAAAFGDKMATNVARAGRPGLPSEIADIIIFMASPESGWIKGQDICVDGGMGAMAISDALGLPK